MAVEKSPFFRPSSADRMVVIRQRTPKGTQHEITQEASPEHKATLLGTCSNLVNAIVGSGIVGIPFAISQCGFTAGVFLTIFVALVTEKSLRVLVFTAKHIHVPTYETLSEACFGKLGFNFVAVNMFITSFGAMISYLMVVKDCFGTLILQGTNDTPLMRRTLLLIISLCVMLPVACKRDMADLAQTSRLNVLIDSTLVTIIAMNSPIRQEAERIEAHPELSMNMWIHFDTVFVGLGVLSFAFVCQHSAFLIAGSLKSPTVKRWSTVTNGALWFCVTLALLCGIFGYLGYRDATVGNILDNLDANSVSANIARGMLGTTMLFVYPLESFVSRHVCVVLLFSGRAAHEGDDAHILSRRDRRVILTTALYVMAVIPAALATDLGPVLALTGAVGGSCLAYLGPGAVFLGVHGERFLNLVRRAWFGNHHRQTNSIGEARLTELSDKSETTPLVAGKEQSNTEQPTLIEVVSIHGSNLEGFCQRMAWYALGMPIWCSIAKIGKENMQRHIHEIALKSPHPIRIGDVEYKRMLIRSGVSIEKQLERISSLRENATLPLVKSDIDIRGSAGVFKNDSGTSINQLVGKELLEKQQKKQELERDPQEEPPSWGDFYVAIGFMLLGVMALFAGVYSLL